MKIEVYKFGDFWHIDIIAASNGTHIMRSARGYSRKRNALEAARLLKKQVGKAEIVEL